jgi:hypothetical protein
MRRPALLAALALCASPALHAQEGQVVWPAERPISKSAERIARELWPTDVATSPIDEEGRPRFRSGITVTILLPPPWRLTPDTAPTPSRGAISHQEMLRMMTPREYSTPPIGGGGSVDPGSIFQSIRSAWRDWQARRIEKRVMRELEELERRNRAAEEEAK